jgi:hypothetical protein
LLTLACSPKSPAISVVVALLPVEVILQRSVPTMLRLPPERVVVMGIACFVLTPHAVAGTAEKPRTKMMEYAAMNISIARGNTKPILCNFNSDLLKKVLEEDDCSVFPTVDLGYGREWDEMGFSIVAPTSNNSVVSFGRIPSATRLKRLID